MQLKYTTRTLEPWKPEDASAIIRITNELWEHLPEEVRALYEGEVGGKSIGGLMRAYPASFRDALGRRIVPSTAGEPFTWLPPVPVKTPLEDWHERAIEFAGRWMQRSRLGLNRDELREEWQNMLDERAALDERTREEVDRYAWDDAMKLYHASKKGAA